MNLFSYFYGIPKSRGEELLEKIGLKKKKDSWTKSLSGGQRQKLALAIALIHEPKIIILDEPTTGLDPHARRDIWNILLSLKSKKTTLLLTTHYMEEAERLCEKIFIMNEGKILASGTLKELLSRYANEELIEIKTSKKPTGFQDITNVKKSSWDPEQKKLKLVVTSINKALPAILKKISTLNLEVSEIDSRKMTLDDLFVFMTGRQLE